MKDSELKLKSVEDKRQTYQNRLYQGGSTNAKELANMEKEIAALGRQRADLDERILELMEQVEQAQAHVTAAEEQAREADTRHADTVAAFRSRYDALTLELTDLTRRRADAATLVEDKAFLKRYEDIRAKSGGVAIAKIEDGVLRRLPYVPPLLPHQSRQGLRRAAKVRKLWPPPDDLILIKDSIMSSKQAIWTTALSTTLMLTGICPLLRAQAPGITADTEYHTRSSGVDAADKKQHWQMVDLQNIPVGDGALLGWRQWGGRYLETGLVHYDGLHGASSGALGFPDLLSYDPANTYIGNDSYFFVSYKDTRTGDEIRNNQNFVFTFDSLTFTLPADNKPRVLRLWTGAYGCDGEMDADLLSPSGDVLTSYTKTMARPGPSGDADAPDFFYGSWRLRFLGSAPGQTLRVRWRALHRLQASANVSLQAAVVTLAP